MGKFSGYIAQFNMASKVTDEELEDTKQLLSLYGATLRRAGRGIAEMEEECLQRHHKSVVDFIDLAIDFDHETDRRRIAERLAEMGHSMQLLDLMDEALLLVRTEPECGEMYYQLLAKRYYDALCRSNDAALRAICGTSLSRIWSSQRSTRSAASSIA